MNDGNSSGYMESRCVAISKALRDLGVFFDFIPKWYSSDCLSSVTCINLERLTQKGLAFFFLRFMGEPGL